MTQYIDKSALEAEIERLEKINQEYKKTWKWKFKWFYCTIIGRLEVLEGLKNYINALEAKEVDLDKELNKLDSTLYDMDGVAIDDNTNNSETRYLTVEDVKDIAKHFFELGLKTQKGE